VLDEELAPPVEELGQRHRALGPVENVLLVHLHPRQRAALRGQPVAEARELFLFRQKGFAGFEPFLARDDLRRVHRVVPFLS